MLEFPSLLAGRSQWQRGGTRRWHSHWSGNTHLGTVLLLQFEALTQRLLALQPGSTDMAAAWQTAPHRYNY